MLHIDGIIYSLQKYGGITVYFNELLKLLQREGEAYRLLLEHPVHPLQLNPSEYTTDERPARWMERYRSCRLGDSATLFHSSYYRQPAQKSIPTVMTVYDFIYERYVSGIKRMVHSHQKASAIRASQTVICISEATRKDMLHFIGEVPGQAVHVIHCGVSEAFHPLGETSSQRPYVLFVGQRGGYKNFRLAVEALAQLPDLELICVGGGKLGEQDLEGASSSTRQRIKHAGYLDDAGLNRLYNEAVCLLYPSSYEGFGIPVIEAMRAGCPVVSLNCEAVMEVGGDALTVVPESDPKAVSEGIDMTRSSARTVLISKGYEMSRRYSWESTYRQTLDVYRSMA